MTSTLRREIMSSPDGEGDWICYISPNSEWGNYMMESWNNTYVLPYFGPVSGAPAGLLDEEYDNGYGAPERPMYTVWTDDWVVYATEYDGSTGVAWVPRNPKVPRTASEILAAEGLS